MPEIPTKFLEDPKESERIWDSKRIRKQVNGILKNLRALGRTRKDLETPNEPEKIEKIRNNSKEFYTMR